MLFLWDISKVKSIRADLINEFSIEDVYGDGDVSRVYGIRTYPGTSHLNENSNMFWFGDFSTVEEAQAFVDMLHSKMLWAWQAIYIGKRERRA